MARGLSSRLALPVGSGQVFHRDHPVRTGLVTSQPVGLALVLVTYGERTSRADGGLSPWRVTPMTGNRTPLWR